MNVFGSLKRVIGLGGGDQDGGERPSKKQKKKQQVKDDDSPELNEFERLRQQNIKENKSVLANLNFGGMKMMLGIGGTPKEGKGGGGKKVATPGAGGPIKPPIRLPSVPEVIDKWAERGDQIKLLSKLLPALPSTSPKNAEPVDECPSQVLLLHGPSGTGKTGVMKDLIAALRLPHAFVRGVEHSNARTLYGTIAAAWTEYAQVEAHNIQSAMQEAEEEEEEEEEEESSDEEEEDSDDEEDDSSDDEEEDDEEEDGSPVLKQSKPKKKVCFAEQEEEEGGQGEDDGKRGGGGVGQEEESEEEEDDDDDEEDQLASRRSAAAAGGKEREREEASEYARYTAPDLPTESETISSIVGVEVEAKNGGSNSKRHNSVLGLLRLLRSWRGKHVPFVIILDSADRLPRGAAHVCHELLELPAMLAEPRGSNRRRCLVSLTVIFISETPTVAPGAFESAQALNIHFPSYTRTQAESILLRSLRIAAGLPPQTSSSSSSSSSPSSASKFDRLMTAFVQFLVASLYSSTRDVMEMRRIAVLLSEKYLEPLLLMESQQTEEEEGRGGGGRGTGGVEETKESGGGGGGGSKSMGAMANEHALLERIRPLIQRAVKNCLHLPAEPLEVQSAATARRGSTAGMAPLMMMTMMNRSNSGGSGAVDKKPSVGQVRHQALIQYELPKLARFLILSAYIASHNSQDTDVYLFTTKNRGRRKSQKGPTGQQRADDKREAEMEAEGANAFPLDRLLSIFTTLVSFNGGNSAGMAKQTGNTELFAQINSLVHFRLLTRIGGSNSGGGGGGEKGRGGGGGGAASVGALAGGELSSIKYKCNVAYDIVLKIAQDLEVPLNMYLQAGRAAY